MSFGLSTDSLQWSNHFVQQIGLLDEFKGAWNVQRQSATIDVAGLKKKMLLDSAGASFRLSGKKLDQDEVGAFFENPSAVQDREEARWIWGLRDLFLYVESEAPNLEINEELLFDLQLRFCYYLPTSVTGELGYKQSESVWKVGGRVLAESVPAQYVAQEMKTLLSWYETERQRYVLHPILLSGMFSALFMAIQPFEKGNEHVARALRELILLQAGYDHLRLASLERVLEGRQRPYLDAASMTVRSVLEGSPDWTPWLQCYLGALTEQLQAIKISIDEQDRRTAVPPLAKTILEFAQKRRSFKMAELETFTKESRSTLLYHIQRLVKSGDLVRRGSGKGTFYGPRQSKF